MILDFYRSDPRAIIPTRAHAADSGWDLFSLTDLVIRPGEVITVPTGIHVALARGWGGYIQDKSGRGALGLKYLGGVIDTPYVGEIKVTVVNLNIWPMLSEIIEDPDNTYPLLTRIARAASDHTIHIPYGKAVAQICFLKNSSIDSLIELPEDSFRVQYSHRYAPDQRGEKGFSSSDSARRTGPEFPTQDRS